METEVTRVRVVDGVNRLDKVVRQISPDKIIAVTQDGTKYTVVYKSKERIGL